MQHVSIRRMKATTAQIRSTFSNFKAIITMLLCLLQFHLLTNFETKSLKNIGIYMTHSIVMFCFVLF